MGDEKARNFPAWILDVHYLPPGPSRPRAALDAIRQVFSLGSVFFADNLFTFGKSLEFLRDEKFTETFFAASTSLQDKALVWRKHTLYWAARRAMQLEGDFVEAGCYEGFTAQVLCNLLDLKAAGKQFWMYDRFDAPANEEYRLPEHSTSLHQRVIHRFADRPEVKIIKGDLPRSLEAGRPEKISLLHLDMNNADAELAVLDALFDSVVPEGAIVLDDYGFAEYVSQTRAHAAWFAARNLPILELPTGQGLVIKPGKVG